MCLATLFVIATIYASSVEQRFKIACTAILLLIVMACLVGFALHHWFIVCFRRASLAADETADLADVSGDKRKEDDQREPGEKMRRLRSLQLSPATAAISTEQEESVPMYHATTPAMTRQGSEVSMVGTPSGGGAAPLLGSGASTSSPVHAWRSATVVETGSTVGDEDVVIFDTTMIELPSTPLPSARIHRQQQQQQPVSPRNIHVRVESAVAGAGDDEEGEDEDGSDIQPLPIPPRPRVLSPRNAAARQTSPSSASSPPPPLPPLPARNLLRHLESTTSADESTSRTREDPVAAASSAADTTATTTTAAAAAIQAEDQPIIGQDQLELSHADDAQGSTGELCTVQQKNDVSMADTGDNDKTALSMKSLEI